MQQSALAPIFKWPENVLLLEAQVKFLREEWIRADKEYMGYSGNSEIERSQLRIAQADALKAKSTAEVALDAAIRAAQ